MHFKSKLGKVVVDEVEAMCHVLLGGEDECSIVSIEALENLGGSEFLW